VRAAGRVTEMLDQVRDHLLRHARIHRRGGGVVQVDGQFVGAAHAIDSSAGGLSGLFLPGFSEEVLAVVSGLIGQRYQHLRLPSARLYAPSRAWSRRACSGNPQPLP